jgi:hypothetical protein
MPEIHWSNIANWGIVEYVAFVLAARWPHGYRALCNDWDARSLYLARTFSHEPAFTAAVIGQCPAIRI